MEKDLNDKLKQEKLSYFRSKEYRGEQLKVIMDAIDYGIGTDYLQLFDDTSIPAGIMKNMLTAMKEDYGVQEAAFLSAVRQEESGRILLEALKSGVPLPELQAAYRDGMFPIELREKILPLMQGKEAIPEKIGERMEFITEAVRELKESFLRQNSFIEDLKKSMDEKMDIFSVQEKGREADTEVDPYYLELEEQFRLAREDAERLLEEREETVRRLRELEAENKNLHEQLLLQQSLVSELQAKQARDTQENKKVQQNQKADDSLALKEYQAINSSQRMECRENRMEKRTGLLSAFNFPFTRKKPGLMEKLAGELDAGQIAEIRLGIEDGLTEGQLALLADKAMDAEKIRELRMHDHEDIVRKGARGMTQQLQEFIYASEDFKRKSEKLAQSIEINSVLLADSSTEKAGQRNAVLGKLCRQAAQAKEAGNAMETAMQNLEKELMAVKDRQYQRQKEIQQSKGQERGDGR